MNRSTVYQRGLKSRMGTAMLRTPRSLNAYFNRQAVRHTRMVVNANAALARPLTLSVELPNTPIVRRVQPCFRGGTRRVVYKSNVAPVTAEIADPTSTASRAVSTSGV